MRPPRPQDATIFWIMISGLPMITIPSLFSSSTTLNTAFRAWPSDFAPVHTIFPELKIRVAVFGFFNRYTRPGNCSGRYSTPGKTRTIALRSIRWFRVAEATTFSMLMNALPLSDKTHRAPFRMYESSPRFHWTADRDGSRTFGPKGTLGESAPVTPV